jgi:hypothetical protein
VIEQTRGSDVTLNIRQYDPNKNKFIDVFKSRRLTNHQLSIAVDFVILCCDCSSIKPRSLLIFTISPNWFSNKDFTVLRTTVFIN